MARDSHILRVGDENIRVSNEPTATYSWAVLRPDWRNDGWAVEVWCKTEKDAKTVGADVQGQFMTGRLWGSE